MHADKPDEVYEMAEAQLAPHEQPDRELRSSDGGHTLRECGHEHDAAEQAAGATQQRAASAGADAAGEPLALTRPLPATHPQHARADEGKRNPVACSDVDITTGCTGESDAGGKNERHDMRGGGAKGGGVGIRGVKVVVSLDAGGGVVVEARVKGRGRGRD